MEMKTIGTCGQCTFRNDKGECTNEKLHEQDVYSFKRPEEDHLVYSYDEGGKFWVGPKFGCIHWRVKLELEVTEQEFLALKGLK